MSKRFKEIIYKELKNIILIFIIIIIISTTILGIGEVFFK